MSRKNRHRFLLSSRSAKATGRGKIYFWADASPHLRPADAIDVMAGSCVKQKRQRRPQPTLPGRFPSLRPPSLAAASSLLWWACLAHGSSASALREGTGGTAPAGTSFVWAAVASAHSRRVLVQEAQQHDSLSLGQIVMIVLVAVIFALVIAFLGFRAWQEHKRRERRGRSGSKDYGESATEVTACGDRGHGLRP